VATAARVGVFGSGADDLPAAAAVVLSLRSRGRTSAVLMGFAMLVTLGVRAYFHANYLKPPHVEVRPDDALPRAA